MFFSRSTDPLPQGHASLAAPRRPPRVHFRGHLPPPFLLIPAFALLSVCYDLALPHYSEIQLGRRAKSRDVEEQGGRLCLRYSCGASGGGGRAGGRESGATTIQRGPRAAPRVARHARARARGSDYLTPTRTPSARAPCRGRASIARDGGSKFRHHTPSSPPVLHRPPRAPFSVAASRPPRRRASIRRPSGQFGG